MPPEDHRTQYLAVFLIIFAAGMIALGSKFEWRDLVNFAQVFGGGGVGILTGQKLQQMSQRTGDNSTLNASPSAPVQIPEPPKPV